MVSATAAEGRTTVALNLALTPPPTGWRVLLIDADFERGTLSKTLEAGGNAGLFDLIEGRATLSSVLLNDRNPAWISCRSATRPFAEAGIPSRRRSRKS